MQIEYLIADEDQTWGTTIINVPDEVGTEREALVLWAEKNLSQQTRYRSVVLWALYAILHDEHGQVQ